MDQGGEKFQVLTAGGAANLGGSKKKKKRRNQKKKKQQDAVNTSSSAAAAEVRLNLIEYNLDFGNSVGQQNEKFWI